MRSIPTRFKPSRRVLWTDRTMNHFIKVGGLGVIAAVLGIFVFIFYQVIPLFRGAKVTPLSTRQLPTELSDTVLGLNESGSSVFLATRQGKLYVFSEGAAPSAELSLFPVEEQASALVYRPEFQTLGYGTADGRFALLPLPLTLGQADGFEIAKANFLPLGILGTVRALDMSAPGETQVIVALMENTDGLKVRALTLTQEQSLMGVGETKLGAQWDLSSQISERPTQVRINQSGEVLVVATEPGVLYYFHRGASGFELTQRFIPFADQADPRLASLDFIFGGVSLYLSQANGTNRIFSLYVPQDGQKRLFGETKHFAPLAAEATFFSPSLRNKAFLVGAKNVASLRFATTENIRWQQSFSKPLLAGALSRKYNRLALLDQQNTLHLFKLEDPHPEGGLKAFFGKVWYEGASQPEYAWQSSGGSDSFEPKLSLIPLIIGTLKGTLYALIFSIPIALLAALYTSQFLNPSLRKFIKPVMEIMASLPSVILGFLAALWLAPRIEDKIPSVILALVLVPLAAFLLGILWTRLPVTLRSRLPQGQEWLVMIPVLLFAFWGAWHLGPVLERFLFVVTDPQTGQKIADFRLWWPLVTGTPFEQRNSLVVGFMMGFAVIPIIFTIAEDSLSAVPQNLRSGALALGASRWQTAFSVVMPTAFAGISSAIMIGLGRAVGETMIVLMATGNTPILSFNIFSGMRTLSANLAVELPEAPLLGTLYRTLFLGALLLFAMTFLLNTLAELLRHRIRERFKTL